MNVYTSTGVSFGPIVFSNIIFLRVGWMRWKTTPEILCFKGMPVNLKGKYYKAIDQLCYIEQ